MAVAADESGAAAEILAARECGGLVETTAAQDWRVAAETLAAEASRVGPSRRSGPESASAPGPAVGGATADSGGGTRAAGTAPGPAGASTAGPGVHARVIVNSCVDVRFVDAMVDWLREQGLRGEYDLRTHEGASLAVDRWVESDALLSGLHDVEAVWIVDHENCGAYRVAGEPDTRENHVVRLKMAQARVQAWLGKPVRIFYHPLGPDGRGAAFIEEIGP